MRLKIDKIRRLADLLYDALKVQKDLQLEPDKAAVCALIEKVIEADMLAEDDIREEAEAMLAGHMDEIRKSDAQYSDVLRKTMQRLARGKRMVL